MRTQEAAHRHASACELGATAIVVTHNSHTEIGDCLAALRASGVTVRVVDNASTDGTTSLVAASYPDTWLAANTDNVGFAAAVNQALAGVTSDVVLLVNPDCVLRPGTAQALVGLLRDCPDVGVAGPRLVGPDGRARVSAHPFESWVSVVVSRFGGSLLPFALRRLLCGRRRRQTYDACRDEPGAPIDVDWLSGACLAVRTSLLTELGGLDTAYFMYYEDEELCLQVAARGARVVYLPSVEAMHIGGASTNDPRRIWPHLYRSMMRFFVRHRRRSYPVIRLAVLVRALLGVAFAVPRSLGRSTTARARARAWAEVARIALAAKPSAIERGNTCTS